MFEDLHIEPMPAVPPRPVVLTRWQRISRWLSDNFTTSNIVVRRTKEVPNKPWYLCMGYAPIQSWEPEAHRALVTYRWNAAYIAKRWTERGGDIYNYEVVRQSEMKDLK